MSIKGDILDNIKTVLETITIANSYNQTVVSVAVDEIRDPNSMQADEFPCLFVINDSSNNEDGDVDSLMVKMNLIISGYIKATNYDYDIRTARENLENDVEKALMLDETRGGKALFTKFTKLENDKGMLKPFGIFDYYLTVEYLRDRNNPAEQDNNP